jgi:UDP-N-acetylglucosamine--N-acetylmuramyl-(pentapeptide) pyrophosphoryl-undecaprenol N-acetylglucosamine transferase
VKKVVLAAGGSGGHLLPAQQLRALLGNRADVVLAGHNVSQNPFVAKEMVSYDIPSAPLQKGKYLRFIYENFKGILRAIALLYRFQPDVVVGFGSYHAFPVLAAAFLLRKKIVLFEANCILGKVNRLFAKAASSVAVQFRLKKKMENTVFVPILPWIVSTKKGASKQEAYAYFGLEEGKKTVLVFGGSQGAQFFNEKIPLVLDSFPDLQILHLTGKGGKAEYSHPIACCKEFETRMDLAYLIADVVISRSGAGTVAELLSYQKPALLIPFPFATEGHQLENGKFLALDVGGAILVEQSKATIAILEENFRELLATLAQKQAALCSFDRKKEIGLEKLILGEII